MLSSDGKQIEVGQRVRIKSRPCTRLGIDYLLPPLWGKVTRTYITPKGHEAVEAFTEYGFYTIDAKYIRVRNGKSAKQKLMDRREKGIKRQNQPARDSSGIFCLKCNKERPKQRGRPPKAWLCKSCLK